ncbi:MAG: aminoglycoside phosphotransferase family protein, partial [bacterium]
MTNPSERHLAWAASIIGADATVTGVEGMHEGSSPWLCEIRSDGQVIQAVLRVADWDRIWGPAIVTAAAGLQVAAAHDLPTPRLLGCDRDGTATGSPALLETQFAGSNRPPGQDALYSAGAVLAGVHKIRLDETEDLPVRTHHNPYDDSRIERRQAALYRRASSADRAAMLDEFCQPDPGADRRTVQDMWENAQTSPLLLEADARVGRLRPPEGATVFVHADVWLYNMHWLNDQCLGLIDWKSAGVGHPGVDIGALRMQAVLAYDASAADPVTAGWEDN